MAGETYTITINALGVRKVVADINTIGEAATNVANQLRQLDTKLNPIKLRFLIDSKEINRILQSIRLSPINVRVNAIQQSLPRLPRVPRTVAPGLGPINPADVDRLGTSLQRVERHASAARRALGLMRSTLVVLATAGALRGLVETVDAMTLMNNRLQAVTSSARVATAIQQRLFIVSQETGTAFQDNATIFARMTRATTSLNLTFNELSDITQGIAQSVLLSGSTTAEATGALIQFSQALASNFRTPAQELNSIIEQLPFLATVISKEFGVSAGNLKKFVENNKDLVTTERVIRGIQKALPEINEQFQRTNLTLGQAFIRLNNALQFFLGGLGNATGASRALAQAVSFVADNIDKVALGLAALGSIVAINVLIDQLARLNALVILLGVNLAKAGGIALRVFTVLLVPITALRVALTLIGAVTITNFIKPLIFASKFLLGFFLALPIAVFKTATAVVGLAKGTTTLLGILRGIGAFLISPFLVGAVVVGTLIGLFVIFQDEIEAVIKELGGFEGIFNTIVAGAIAGVTTILETWRLFPAALVDITFQAANGFLSGIEGMLNTGITLFNDFAKKIASIFTFIVNDVIDLINIPIRKVNSEIDRLESLGLNPGIGRINEIETREIRFEPVGTLDLGGLDNPAAGAAAKLGEEAGRIFNETFAKVLGSTSTDPTAHPDFQSTVTGPFSIIKNKLNQGIDFVGQFVLGNIDVDEITKVLQEVNKATAGLDQGDLGGGDGTGTDKKSLEDRSKELVDGLNSIEEAANAAAKGMRGIGAVGRDFGKSNEDFLAAKDALTSLLDTIDPYSVKLREITNAQDVLTEAHRQGVNIRLEDAEIIRRLTLQQAGFEDNTQKFTDRMNELTLAVQTGGLAWNQYAREVQGAQIELLNSTGDSFDGIRAGLKELNLEATDFATQMKDGVKEAFTALRTDIRESLKQGKLDFEDFGETVLDILLDIAINRALIAPATSFFDDIFAAAVGSTTLTPSKHGNVFNQGKVLPFQHGGVVNKPTLFPLGSMAEVAPEAIFPLTRVGADLGVKGIAPKVNINVYNNANAETEVESSTDAFGNLNIEVLIDEAVGRRISKPGSSTNRAIRRSFDVNQRLISRS